MRDPNRPKVEVKALALIRDSGRLLVSGGEDPVTGEWFFRLLGGTVEFGELASEAIIREIAEELGSGATGVEFLGVLENRFEYAGAPGHQVLFVFDCDLADRSIYARNPVGPILDEPSAMVSWIDEADARAGAVTLYPAGILDLIR